MNRVGSCHHALVQVGRATGAAALAGGGELGRSGEVAAGVLCRRRHQPDVVAGVVAKAQLVAHRDTVRAGAGRDGRPERGARADGHGACGGRERGGARVERCGGDGHLLPTAAVPTAANLAREVKRACGRHHGLVQVGRVPRAAALAGGGELGRSGEVAAGVLCRRRHQPDVVAGVVAKAQLVAHRDTVRAGAGRDGRPERGARADGHGACGARELVSGRVERRADHVPPFVREVAAATLSGGEHGEKPPLQCRGGGRRRGGNRRRGGGGSAA